MKEISKTKNVKMNLTIPPEFYMVLQQKAQEDYVRVATWTKQFLMKNLDEGAYSSVIGSSSLLGKLSTSD